MALERLTLYDHDSMVVFVSAEKNVGTILNATESFCTMFKEQKENIEYANINEFMIAQMKSKHEDVNDPDVQFMYYTIG